MQIPDVKNELITLFFKILPAIIAVLGIKIAVQIKYDKINPVSATMSLIIGVSIAILFLNVIDEYIGSPWDDIILAAIAIVGDKIGYWFIYKFNIDILLTKISSAVSQTIINFFKK